MPTTRSLLILPNTAFTQCSVKDEATSIHIYDTRHVEVSTKQRQKVTIQPCDLSWQQFPQLPVPAFLAYLKVCHFELRQFNTGEYRLISLVRGLGGGNGQSSGNKEKRPNAAKTQAKFSDWTQVFLDALGKATPLQLSPSEQRGGFVELLVPTQALIQALAKTTTRDPAICEIALEILPVFLDPLRNCIRNEELINLPSIAAFECSIQEQTKTPAKAALAARIALAMSQELSKTLTDALDLAEIPWLVPFVVGKKILALQMLLDPRSNFNDDEWDTFKLAIEEGHIEEVESLLKKYPDLCNASCFDSKRTPLMVAAERGHIELVKLLVDTYDVNTRAKDNAGWDAFMMAIVNRRTQVVEFLLEKYPDLGNASCFDSKRTPLMVAAERGHIELVKLLVDTYDVNTRAKDNAGWDAFLFAITGGRTQVVEFLLEKYPDLGNASYFDSNHTPLILAAQEGHIAIVKLLVDTYDVNIWAKENAGWDAFLFAITGGRIQVVEFLLKKCRELCNASYFDSNRTPLMVAARKGHIELVKLLVDTHHVNIRAKDNTGCDAFMLAMQYGRIQVVEFLLKKCCELGNASYRDSNHTPLMVAAECGHIELVKLLVDTHHVNTRAKDNTGWDAFLLAIANRRIQVVEFFLERCGDLGNASYLGRDVTPLMLAAECGHIELVKLLVDIYHIDIASKDNTGRDALAHAVKNGHVEIVKLLRQYGANLHRTNKNRVPLLMLAIQNGHVAMAKYLLSRGVVISQIDAQGKTALDYARKRNRLKGDMTEIVDILESASGIELTSAAVQRATR